MNEKHILNLLVGPGIFSNKEIKEVVSKAFHPKFLKEFDELNIKLPEDTKEPANYGDDASPIQIDEEEEKRIEDEQAHLQEKYRSFALSTGPNKNPFQRNRIEEEDFDDFEDTAPQERQATILIPKIIVPRPNPYENLPLKEFLPVVGWDKQHEIFKLTDTYLPTTEENRRNALKYVHKYLLKDPREFLKHYSSRHDRIVKEEKDLLRIYKQAYEQILSVKAETTFVPKVQEPEITILKDIIKNTSLFPFDTAFSPLNSTQWFESLQHELLANISTTTIPEIEKPAKAQSKEPQEPLANGVPHAHEDGGLFGAEKYLDSARRIATPNFQKGEKPYMNRGYSVSSLFDSTPTRENRPPSAWGGHISLNIFGAESPRHEADENSFSNTGYNRVVNKNMREYLDEHYEKDKKSLYRFYTALKGNDKKETSLWGEPKEASSSHNRTPDISYSYLLLPFRSSENQPIFKYEIDANESSELGLSSLSKKQKISETGERSLRQKLLDNNFYNKNVLEASWNDFFLSDKPRAKYQKEYSQILIDLNDKSVFYDKIHPHIFGVQKASKKTAISTVLEDIPEGPGQMEIEDNRDQPGVDATDLEKLPSTSFKAPLGRDMMSAAGDRTLQGASETDSVSVSKTSKQVHIDRIKKEKKKALRIIAVKQGLDPDKLTVEDIESLLNKNEKNQAAAGAVALPNVLKLVNTLKKKAAHSTVIQHSRVAEEFEFNDFYIKPADYARFHRPDLQYIKDRDMSGNEPWRVEIPRVEESKNTTGSDDPFEVNELVDSFEYFKNHKRLSLREGKFGLFEFIEENPLIVSNVGMASRITRYVYTQRAYSKVKAKQAKKAMNEREELNEFVALIKETLGKNGSITFLDNKQNLPLIGQLTNEKYIGVTVMENNLYYAPIFIQKAPETDFVLVKYQTSDGLWKYTLRKIEYIYTVGQIEPKVEVFNPSCRNLTSFIRKSIKHVIKKKFSQGKPVTMREMNKLFPTVNDHNMKKYIQYYGGDPDPADNKTFYYNKDLDHELIDDDPEKNEGNITPEEVCQYERMHASNVRLRNMGLEDLRSCDKINTIRNRYIRRNNQLIWDDKTDDNLRRKLVKMNIVANYSAEELQLTAWNLSQSFLISKQKQGRMYLTGFGDPTNGHGGYSYVKLPLKTSRYEKEDKKNAAKSGSQVTGTDADLRKLPMKHVDKIILKYGTYKEEHLSKLSRWDKIELLRQIANDHPEDEELSKYARVLRFTTKMQREKYQKDINTLFMTMIDTLSKQDNNDIESDDEGQFEVVVDSLIPKELEEIMSKKPKSGEIPDPNAGLRDDEDLFDDDG